MRMHFFNQHVRDIVIILEEGKPPSPKVPTMLHAGPIEGIKRQATRHHAVQKGRGKEEALDGGGRVEGYHKEGL